MAALDSFPITRKWPVKFPDRIQLYSLPTPNGVKVSIMLEETALPYEPHLVDFDNNDQLSPEFLSLNPNNKIPAIIDPNGPDGAPLPTAPLPPGAARPVVPAPGAATGPSKTSTGVMGGTGPAPNSPR